MNRTLENELSNIRSVLALNQENESNSWKRAFQRSISRCPWTKKTNRTLENELSNARSVVALNQENESNSWKRAFQHSISRCPEPRKRIELLKTSFPTFDQSFPWTKKTNRTLENELSNIRSVVALNQVNESNSWKWAFQHSISRCPEPRKRIELLKMSFPTFDQSLPWTKKTNRTLENELSNIRSVVALNQENESNSWKRAFQHSIGPCPEPSKRIELLKTSFPTFDQSLLWTKKTNRTLENEFSNIRSVVALNQENESNSWKWAFQHSISRCPEPRKRIELFENELSNIRSVVALNQENESNSWKWAFQHSIGPRPEPSKRIELLKTSFPTFDQSLPWTKKTNRTLENIECWKTRFQEFDSFPSVVALNQVNESNSWKRAFQHSISRCPEPRKRIELLKTSFPTFDQSLPWTKKTNRTLENELSNARWFRATTDRMLESSFSRVRFVFLVQGNDWSNVGKLIFKSSIRFLGSGQRLIEGWKAHFQEFDSFSWFRATTDRMLESSFSRVRFIYLVQGNDWSSVGKLIFKSSIRFLGSGQQLIERWKVHFQEFDSFSWFRATTDRVLESSFSRVRFVYLVQGKDWSNVGKLVYKSSIRFLGSGQRLIECWKAHFQEFDSFSSVVALNQENESNSCKQAFQHSISPCPEPSKRIELLKMSFPTLDQSLPWTKKTNRTLENELSNIRSVVALNQENESNSWKWVFQHSISPCPEPSKRIELLKTSFPTFDGSGQRLIERWKAHFQEFDSFSWFRATTDRALESSFSRVRFVFLVQGNDWSNVGKLIFKSSIHLLGSGQWLIERWKAHFQEFDSFSWFRATTDRVLESSFSRVRFVFLVQGKDWSNVGKLVYKSSIRFPWFRATTDRMLESSFSRVRFVFFSRCPEPRKTNRTLVNKLSNIRSVLALNQENESNSWKWAFQHSISRCPEPRKRIELLKTSFPTFDQSLPWTKKTNRTLENEFSNIRSVLALNQVNESNSWKRAFQHSISRCPEHSKLIELLKTSFPTFDQSLPWTKENESNSWKRAFQHSISPCPEPRKRIELLKMSFPTFDQSLLWTKKTNRTPLESSFSRVRFVFLVQGKDRSNVGKLVFKSSIRFLGSRARTDRMLESSFSRVRFVFFSRCPEPRKRIELLKTSFPTFDQSLPWTKKTNRTLENELSNIRSVLALEPRKRIELLKTSFPTFDRSLPWTRKTNRTLENELSNARSVVALNPRKRIELLKTSFPTFDQSLPWTKKTNRLLKMSFPTLDQSLPWTKKTNRTLENELSNIRSVVSLNQENESNSWKWAFQHSISRCPEPSKRIELLKMSFPTFDQSLPWTKKTNRTLENELSNIRSVVALNQENESNSWKRAFQHSIGRCPEPRKRIELLKMSFPTFDRSLPWTK